MHGRLKVKSTAEQLEAKKKEKEVKLIAFQTGKQRIFSKRENNELDDEALTLTKTFLQENPDFYTLWNFRAEIFLHLQAEKSEDEFQGLCSDELFLTQSCLMKNPKSYGAWHHRGWVLDIMPQPDWEMELKLCDKFLSMDERNFHCWDYRRSVCRKRCVKPEDELSFTTDLIERNFSNYSAWHYRSTLLPIVHPDEESKLVDENILQKEYDLVQNAAFTDPYDQSVWFYHRWLLGRGERPLEITTMYVSKELSSVIIVLSAPEKVNETCFLKLQINYKDENITWKPACNHPYACKVWVCKLAPDVFSNNGKMEIVAVLSKGQMQSCTSCTVNKAEAIHWSALHQKFAFVSELSAATKDVLQRELDSCETLCELEPENKWSLFTCVLIMKALDSHKYKESISSHLERLTEVDPLRTRYYKDLKSKFIIEDFLENSALETKELSLVNQGLTSLNHFDYLVHIRKVDLALNNLTDIYPIHLLLCVEHLILDDNKITDCKDFRELKCLKKLSLRNNCIKSLEYLQPLAFCPNLEYLWVEGNPVTNELDFYSKIKDLLKIKLDNYVL